MNLETIVKDIFHANTQSYPLVPRSIVTSTRQEFTNLKLEIDGTLPEDLNGHVFIIEPNSSVDLKGLPYPDGNSILGGDGMVYRLDFNQPGEVNFNSRLVKPPDFYADLATQSGTYAQYKFQNHGITRFSFALGCRNQLNTAFLPMQFSSDSPTRLLVTYDAGRPYEIDPQTLELVTPVGATKEWKTQIQGLNVPFELYMSTAHPAFDGYTKTMFTVNFGRSANNFLQTIPFVYGIEKLLESIHEILMSIIQAIHIRIVQKFLEALINHWQSVLQNYMELIEKLIPIELKDFLYLLSWDGENELQRWQLVLADGSPVEIDQCIHQIGVTQDYVVIMDTAYSVGIDELINNPFPENKQFEQFLREHLERPAQPNSNIYIVRRQDLKSGQDLASDSQAVKVVVQKVVIPLATAHFLVNYDNPDGNITIHAAHICGMKVSDWLREYDVSVYSPNNPVPSNLCGMIENEVDIGRMGKYVINGETGDLVESCVICDRNWTWGVELFAYLDRLPSGLQPRKLEQIYWCSLGLWQELMTKFIVNINKNYQYQLVPQKQVLNLAQKGLPSNIFRMDTESMKIVDAYAFPDGYMGLSPQFIPRGNGEDPTYGYLLCTVWFDNTNEFWIFDAQNLSKGVICRLRNDSLNFAFTLHTTWLSTLSPRQASYCIGVRDDYEQLVQQQPQGIQDLFKQEIYPYFSC